MIEWDKLRGSKEGLKWNRKEVHNLKEVMLMVPRRDAVVQAGANLGVFPKYMSYHFKTVYTFEPEPELFEIVCYNAPERNIVKFQAAVGCERQTVNISRVRRQKDGGISHEGISHVAGPGVIPTLQIDDLGLSVCNLIYLDIEGYEYYAIRGAIKTLHRCKPLVALEVNKSLEHMGGITRDTIHNQMRALDYTFHGKIGNDEIFVP